MKRRREWKERRVKVKERSRRGWNKRRVKKVRVKLKQSRGEWDGRNER